MCLCVANISDSEYLLYVPADRVGHVRFCDPVVVYILT